MISGCVRQFRTSSLAAPTLALAALLAASCAAPRGTADRPAVTGIDIKGAEEVDGDDVAGKLATQPSDPWWKLFWREARFFDEDAFANDQRRVVRYYQSRGYYQARVVEAAAKPDGDGRVKIEIRVDEGAPSRVRTLDITGLDAAPGVRERAGDLPLAVGDVFTEAAYDATRDLLQLALESTGYPRARVAQHAEVHPASGEVHVTYAVEHEVKGAPGEPVVRAPGPGERYTFGNIFVAGAGAIPRSRVREEAEVVLEPGEIFDVTQLAEVQGRIFDLGVFGGVRVTQGPLDEKRKTIPVVVSVREAPFRTIRMGPSIGVAANRWDTSLVAGWSHRNWLGDLRRLSFDARLGYAWIPSPLAPQEQGPVALVTGEFQQPGIIRRRVDLTTRVELERGLQEGYSFTSERFRVGTPIHLGRSLTLVPSYNLELYQLDLRGSITGAEREGTELLFQCPGGCVLSYLEQRITLDLRDDPIETHSGIYASLAIQEGFQFLGKGFQYLRLLPEVRGYLPLGPRVVAAGRVRVGVLRGTSKNENPPIVARFTSGGPLFMRGYYTRRLSPVAVRGADVAPVGGDRLIDGSFELRAPLAGNFGGALFLDFGNVSFASLDPLGLERLQYAAGAGIRYMTLFGPIRLDVATRLPTSLRKWDQPGVPVVEADAAGNVVPAPGAPRHHEPFVSIHLSLGEAF
jgi:translocation and assembly module TamA